MSGDQQISIRIFQGANLVVPYPALVAEFESPFSTVLPGAQISRLLIELFRRPQITAEISQDEEFDFAGLVADRANHWQEFTQPLGLSKTAWQSEGGSARVALEFFNVDRTRAALQAGLEIATAIFLTTAGNADVGGVVQRVRTLLEKESTPQFASVSNAYIKAARDRRIFVRQISPLTNIVKYGQGAKGFHQREAACSDDSFIGHRLTLNKSSSNQLIRQLGFPGVEHGVVSDLAGARRIAAQLGPPLVVKPIDRNGSTGVTVGIETPRELETAFVEAKREAKSGQVLIERFVPGDDHRLAVFGGKFTRASRLVIAQVLGDGRQTIRELIDSDNVRRRSAAASGDYLFELSLDEKMAALIRKQGFSPDDILPAGKAIRLAGTSNLKSGGHREDVTRLVHPENVAMAESIARNFYLDSVGVDFITEDISKSWTEGRCAIIETNANPGTSHEVAAEVMSARFPEGDDGRIASVLVVGGRGGLTREIAARLEQRGRIVGWTGSDETVLAGAQRFLGAADFPARVLGILLDATCNALVVGCTAKSIDKFGLPHTRYDLALIVEPEGLTKEMHRLVAQNARRCAVRPGLTALDQEILALIEAL